MNNKEIHVVTGAFGYSGKYIAKRLLDAGYQIKTLTNSINRSNPFGNSIKVYPFNFDNCEKLIESLRGASVLYNTYWVRFNHKDFKHSIAVENTLKLFDSAKKAGIRRIVHVSITNPSEVRWLVRRPELSECISKYFCRSSDVCWTEYKYTKCKCRWIFQPMAW